MSVLSLMEGRLPPGFRFYPKDEELVCHYLAKKVAEDRNNSTDQSLIMVDVDLNQNEPWDLPETARVGGKEWYFYSLRDRKYATGIRRNRATASGYWKATGKDRHVTNSLSGMVVGMRKTLVFYQGRAPKGRKTDWVMHEFRLEKPIHPPNTTFRDWVLCRVFHKNSSFGDIPEKQWQDSSFGGSKQCSPLQYPSELSNDDHDQNLQQSPFERLEGSAHMPCISNFTQNIMSTDPIDSSRVFPSEQIMPPRVFSNVIEPLLGMGNSFFNPFVCEKKTAGAVLDQLKIDGIIEKTEVGLKSRGGRLESCLSDHEHMQVRLHADMWNRY